MRLDKGTAHTLEKGEIVTIYDEGHPRGLWKLGRIEELLKGADGNVRGVYVKVASSRGHAKVLRRPIQHVYPLEVYSEPLSGPTRSDLEDRVDKVVPDARSGGETSVKRYERPRRVAAQNSEEITRALVGD